MEQWLHRSRDQLRFGVCGRRLACLRNTWGLVTGNQL
jgi:hypothetical protein